MMCQSCWRDYNYAHDETPEILRAAVLIGRLYEECPTGGPLHCELDDWNLDADVITPTYVINPYGYCPGYPDDYSPAVHEICDELGALLTAMSKPQRAAALARHEGWVPQDLPRHGDSTARA